MTKGIDLKSLGKNILRLRKAAGFSNQLELAEKAKVSIGVIKKLESGAGEGSFESRAAIATALGVYVHELYFFPESESEVKQSFSDLTEELSNALKVIRGDNKSPRPNSHEDQLLSRLTKILGTQGIEDVLNAKKVDVDFALMTLRERFQPSHLKDYLKEGRSSPRSRQSRKSQGNVGS